MENEIKGQKHRPEFEMFLFASSRALKSIIAAVCIGLIYVAVCTYLLLLHYCTNRLCAALLGLMPAVALIGYFSDVLSNSKNAYMTVSGYSWDLKRFSNRMKLKFIVLWFIALIALLAFAIAWVQHLKL
jgi:ABC-type enterochelin transport system permease subunit